MKQKKSNPSILLQEAWRDSLTIEEEEILPLITITKEDSNVLWNRTGDHVLMLSFHRHPECYQHCGPMQLHTGEIWVTSFLEMKHWYDRHSKENSHVDNWTARFEQLLGVDLSGTETHFTAFWLRPEDMIRPAYNPDVTSSKVWNQFPPDFQDYEYIQWFHRHARKAYHQKKLPWTRLGYTYDWEDNGTEYGLCEFLVKKGAHALIQFTKTIPEFVDYLQNYPVDQLDSDSVNL